jgi:hypothetical protein
MKYCSREGENFPDDEFTWDAAINAWMHKTADDPDGHLKDRVGPSVVVHPIPQPLDFPPNVSDDH